MPVETNAKRVAAPEGDRPVNLLFHALTRPRRYEANPHFPRRPLPLDRRPSVAKSGCSKHLQGLICWTKNGNNNNNNNNHNHPSPIALAPNRAPSFFLGFDKRVTPPRPILAAPMADRTVYSRTSFLVPRSIAPFFLGRVRMVIIYTWHSSLLSCSLVQYMSFLSL
jgi:hypothetical protein